MSQAKMEALVGKAKRLTADKPIKTFAAWNGNLNDYLQIGDIVDEEMYHYFINVLPPATFTSHIVQIGEPYQHITNKPTFMTLEHTDKGWQYQGHCFKGEAISAKESLIARTLKHCGYDQDEPTETNLINCFLDYVDSGKFRDMDSEETKEEIEDGQITWTEICYNLLK